MEDVSAAHLRALIRHTHTLEERIRRIQQTISHQAAQFAEEASLYPASLGESLGQESDAAIDSQATSQRLRLRQAMRSDGSILKYYQYD